LITEQVASGELYGGGKHLIVYLFLTRYLQCKFSKIPKSGVNILAFEKIEKNLEGLPRAQSGASK
jgi:hypothetical protein